jgi:diaminopimelate epimerase
VPHFVKYQALGNDYLIVDPQQVDVAPCGANARLLCDRRFGVGADGVMFGPTRPPVASKPAEVLVFNSDGSPCGLTGNGIRMFALYLAEHYLAAQDPPVLTIRTAAGDSMVRIQDRAGGIVGITLGVPRFTDPGAVPGRRPLEVGGRRVEVTSLELGNPHVVVPLPELSVELARELGAAIAGHPCFPYRVNVEFVRVRGRDAVDAEIWERGAGYTLGSASGACAVACATRALGLTGDTVSVRMPGGVLRVDLAADGTPTLTGPVTELASGRLAPPLLRQLER